jgi:hypothetical protein
MLLVLGEGASPILGPKVAGETVPHGDTIIYRQKDEVEIKGVKISAYSRHELGIRYFICK